jgi:hypothetical protein
MAAPLRQENSGKDVSIYMGGTLVAGARKVEYSVTQEVEQIFVLGTSDAYAQSVTTKKVEGTLTILHSELRRLELALAIQGVDVTSARGLSITMSLAPLAGSTATGGFYSLDNVIFESFSIAWEQGSAFTEVPLKFKAVARRLVA